MKDLSGSNYIPEILERRERLIPWINLLKGLEREKIEIDRELRDLMGDSLMGTLPGWEIEIKHKPRSGYTVEPTIIKTLIIRRKGQ